MHLARSLGLVALISGAFFSGDAAGADPPLTCSFINEQCLVECGKEARPMICLHYCTGRKNSCMFTGRWNGRFDDMFTDVIKQ
jgi:hypothetical protein